MFRPPPTVGGAGSSEIGTAGEVDVLLAVPAIGPDHERLSSRQLSPSASAPSDLGADVVFATHRWWLPYALPGPSAHGHVPPMSSEVTQPVSTPERWNP
jgi:hypothetical protein